MSNKKIFRSLFSLVLLGFLGSPLFGRENVGQKQSSNKGLRAAASCAPSSSSVELDVNNVRALLHNGGDMWWDLSNNPRYEVPKLPADQAASAKHSSFAGSLWIGGVDESGQLRVAAQTYRQSGNDFWPGPLTPNGGTVDDVTCEQWDKHFKIEKVEIDAFRAAYAAFLDGGAAVNMDNYPNVKGWPAFGEDSEGNRLSLAPFVDVDGDPFNYTPEAGDYPNIAPCEGGGEPDQAIWWVINDKGDIHTETGGEAIGLEIQMLAFAFSTSNAINDMTFYKYNVINKSTLTLNDTYLGQWVDADIGNAFDDYVGCDTVRGLGFAYNGLATDGTAGGYGTNPPALGVDFFQGPFGDNLQRLPMQKFVYYENDFSLRGNPEVATHYYGYLRGSWKDGSQMVSNNSNGYPGTAPGPVTDFMYPGDAGWCGGTPSGWSEVSANNNAYDRRFLQSAGPFSLQPGDVNDIITGAVWARGYYNDNLGSVCELLTADDIAQALFDNCFQLLDGPDAPEVAIEEYDRELMISWNYPELKRDLYNNFNEQYCQVDPVLVSQGVPDSLFKFEGYILYQLKDASVSASDLFNSDLARIVVQCDVENDISTIVNRTKQTVAGLPTPVIVDEVMVQGSNEGIVNSVSVTEDLFASGDDRRLKNYTTYYYGILAYAYNDTTSDGRKFVQGNRFFSNTPGMPHKINFENFGTEVYAGYGDGLQVTQIAGVGNGGNFVQLTNATEDAIIANDSVASITYLKGSAPVTVKVVNPKELISGDYRLELVTDSFAGLEEYVAFEDSTNYIIDSTFYDWLLYESNSVVGRSTYIKRVSRGSFGNNEISRPRPLSGIERIVEGHGISIAVSDPFDAGDTLRNGVIGSAITFADPLQPWLQGMGDVDANEPFNWLLCGDDDTDRGHGNDGNPFKVKDFYDKEENFETMAGGAWGPFGMAKSFSSPDASGEIKPGVTVNTSTNSANWIQIDSAISLSELADVDIVFTSDIDKWSRSIVVETASSDLLGTGAWPMSARWDYPILQRGSNEKDTNVTRDSLQGWSWFPGYAVDVNSGRRLNVFFGENSWDRANNGDDMVFNPTSDFGPSRDLAGGRHFVYVTDMTYDGCESIYEILKNGLASDYRNASGIGLSGSQLWMDPPGGPSNPADTSNDMRRVYQRVAWVGIPMLNPNYEVNDPRDIPTDARVQLRVNRPFRSRENVTDYPIFTFNTQNLAAQFTVQEVAESALDEVLVVPNPYYAYSRYEASQVQTIVKLTNLPQKCNINIYTLNGTLIRSFIKDSDNPEQRWDLKNSSGTPVASGVYIIHVDAGELGEKIVKFFAVMPQSDLNAF